MAEPDRFELDLAAALRMYAEDAPTGVRPTELAHRLATTHPRGPVALARWGFASVPGIAWALLLVGLLCASVVGSLAIASWRRDLAVVIGPSPTPTVAPSATLALSPSPTPLPSRASFAPTPVPSAPPLPDRILGTWQGTWGENAAQYGSTAPLDLTVTLRQCALGEVCGRQYSRGIDAAGREVGCGWDLIYDGVAYDLLPGVPQSELQPWFRFREGTAEAVGGFTECSSQATCRDYVATLGDRLRFKATCVTDGSWWQGPYDLDRIGP